MQNLMDTGIQLGRRFRALKLWMVLRHFGAEGIRDAARRAHPPRAAVRARGSTSSADFERTAPAPFSVVCFRADGVRRVQRAAARPHQRLGRDFPLAHQARRRYTLRLAIGNLHTTERHVARAWTLIQELAGQLKLDALPRVAEHPRGKRRHTSRAAQPRHCRSEAHALQRRTVECRIASCAGRRAVAGRRVRPQGEAR